MKNLRHVLVKCWTVVTQFKIIMQKITYHCYDIETYGRKAILLSLPLPTFTSYILKGILSSNMKLFRRYQQEILQRREPRTTYVLTTYRRNVWERNWERKSACFAQYNSDVLSFAITDAARLYNGDSAGSFIRFYEKNPCIISEVWFRSEISLCRIPNEIFIIWLWIPSEHPH